MIKLILFIAIFGTCSAVDIESSKEGECLNPAPKSEKFDILEFVGKSRVLYTPLSTKYSTFQCSEDLIGIEKLKEISDETIKNSCMLITGNGTLLSLRGFNGSEKLFEKNPDSKNSEQWRVVGSKVWDEAWITKVSENYFVTVDCWSTGQKSFAVNSLKKTLDSKEKADAIEHVKSLGFKSEYFYELNYDNCS